MSGGALALAAFYALAARCADMPADPTAARAWTERLAAHAQVESSLRASALNVNGAGGGPQRATSMNEAAALASRLVASGRSVDLGLMQVNSRHLARLGLTASELLEPCRNVAVGAAILADAERTASCIYNTGKPGCRNGYPGRVQAAAARLRSVAAAEAPPARRADPVPPASWDAWAVPLPTQEPEDETTDGGTGAAPPGGQQRVAAEDE